MRFTPKVIQHAQFSSGPGNSLSTQDNPELLKPVNYTNIRQLTENMRRQISQGTVDAPSWDVLRSAKCAANIYAPLGTRMSLGDHVRLVKAYIDVFALAHVPAPQGEEGSGLREEDEGIVRLCANLKVHWTHSSIVLEPLHVPRVEVPRSTSSLGRER